MEFLMHFFELRIRDMRVNLRRPQVLVPEHFLHGPQIGTVPQQIRREGVAQRVRRGIADDACLPRVLFDGVVDGNAREAEFLAWGQCIRRPVMVADEQGTQVI